MPRPLAEYTNPEVNLPNKDIFYKTNRIFNGLFNKNIVIKEGKVSKTNIIGFIDVNFSQTAIRKVVGLYSFDEFLLSCGHTLVSRGNDDIQIEQEAVCFRCGMTAAYRNFEHEWSHIIFKSSPAMFDRFVSMYSAHFGAQVRELIELVIGAFDDLRVNSLWKRVYPGSASEIEGSWKAQCEEDPKLNSNFIPWIFGVALGAENLSQHRGPFHDLIPIAKMATDEVQGRGAANMLLVVKWFLEQCIERLLNPSPKNDEGDGDKEGGESEEEEISDGSPESRDAAARLLSNLASQFQRDQAHYSIDHSNYVNKIAHKVQTSEESALARIFNTPLSKQEVPTLSQQGMRAPIDGDMESAVKALQQSSDGELNDNQSLLTDAAAKVLIADVEPQHILPESRIRIDNEDLNRIERMRAVFAKFIGKKTTKLIEDGDEIDVQALIQYRLDGQDDEVFEDDGLTRGFAYLTLCDMSDSMEGKPFNYVCLGSEMLKHALDYPFVRGYLWGFRGAIGMGSDSYVTLKEKLAALTKGGEVWIYKYHKDCDGYLAKEVPAAGFYANHRDDIPVKCGGMTPTQTGIHIAAKYLSTSVPAGMEKRIFLLTDGNPTQFKVNGEELSKEALHRLVRHEVNEARSKGIRIYTVILGDEITDKEAHEMFGAPAFWRRVPADHIGQTLLELVLREFVRFLRR